jgi:ribonuclease HI
MAIVLVYFDGAVEPVNPGGTATWGFVIRDLPMSDPVYAAGVLASDPKVTNNVAEYAALGKALRWLIDNARVVLGSGDEFIVSGDSKLVVEQVKGAWRCNADNLKPLLARCKELIAALPCKSSIVWIPREQNQLADMLSRAAYVGHTGAPFPVREPKK